MPPDLMEVAHSFRLLVAILGAPCSHGITFLEHLEPQLIMALIFFWN